MKNLKFNRNQRKWGRIGLSALSGIVVFATTYALILPAITLDRGAAAEEPGLRLAESFYEETVFEEEWEEPEFFEIEDDAAFEEDSFEVVDEWDDEMAPEEAPGPDPASEDGAVPSAGEFENADEAEFDDEDRAEAADVNGAEAADGAGNAAGDSTDGTNYAETAAEQEDAALSEAESIPEEAASVVDSPALFFHADLEDVGLVVEADAPAGAFPAGTSMSVLPIYEQSVLDVIAETVEGSVTAVVAVDITFLDADGGRIEPACPIRVTMTSAAIAEAEQTTIVHLDDDGETEVIAPVEDEGAAGEVSEEQVVFEAEAFSIYAIVGTELYGEVTLKNPDGEDVTYLVTVTAPAEAKIPEGSTLKVTSFAEGSADYTNARNAVLADKKEKGEWVDIDNFNLAALDISIIDPNGQEIEPQATVKVDIRIKELPDVDDLNEIKDTLEVQHHVEVADGVVVEKVFDGSIEGSFNMATDEEVAKEGTVVDPRSVSDEDFKNWEEESVEVSFDTEVFSTFTISWSGARGDGVVIHYVDESGNELTVDNGVFPTTIGSNSSSPAHLIYDIDGYEYSYTYRRYYNNNRWNTQNIVPELRRTNGGWQYSTSTSWSGNNLSQSNATNKDEIYVVYKKKADVTKGGSPTLKPVKEEDYPEEPSILKEIDPKTDGTADLSLSITGHTTDREVQKLADVIVVFDLSNSMTSTMSGSTRLATAKTAVNNLVDNLASKKNSDGDPLVRMALIPFSTTVGTITDLTDLTETNTTAFKRTVTNLNAASGNNGGTNWDAALQAANQMTVDSGRATFVIFVTDGDPTFRNTRTNTNDQTLNTSYWVGNNQRYDIGETYYLSYNVYGGGNNDGRNNNYDAAVTQGKAIVAANKNLYTIGISNDVTKVRNFNTAAGGNGAYIASNASALNQAFADIEAAIIAKLGFSEIAMTDGITEMTQTVDKSGLTTTDGSFTYWKKAKGATSFVEWDPASESCEEAEYDEASGAVKWNMGSNFMPEDGATYKVTWKVWPSQEAYDILAKCKNDPSYYDTLSDAQKAQIIRTGTSPNYSYTLLTNEPGAGITYKSATKSGSGVQTEGETKTLPFNTVDPIGMSSDTISIKKIWDNDLDGRAAGNDPIEFTVKADGTDFGTVELSPENNWTENGFNISSGLMTTSGGTQIIYSPGHDFTIVEPENLAYYWDFHADVYRVMVINGTTTVLIKVDTAAEADYTINGGYYKVSSSGAQLTATNERRSYLNLSKNVVDQNNKDLTDDEPFTFTVTITESKGEDVWFSAYDSNAGATVKDSTIATGTGVQYQESDGYFHAPSGTELTLTLKDGWNYRFINLHTGSTYSIEESVPSVDKGYYFKNATATATNSGTAATVNDRSASGTIDKSNADYTVAYVNEFPSIDVQLKKVNDKNTILDGSSFDLTKLSGTTWVAVTSGIAPGDGTEDKPNPVDLGSLGIGRFKLTEKNAPAGYIILSSDVYFEVYRDTDGALKARLTDKDGNVSTSTDPATVTYDSDGKYYLVTVANTQGQALPNTGGPGTLLYTLSGLALIIASALMYGFRMRRRERRIN